MNLFLTIVIALCVVGLMFFQQRSHWIICCSFRREFLMLEGVHEIAKAIAAEDLEAAAGALMEHFQRMTNELRWQDTHSWSALHPLRMPASPDFEGLLKRDPIDS